MRHWLIRVLFLIAVGGLIIAFALPKGTIRDCPLPGFGLRGAAKCIDTPDPRAELRSAIAIAAVPPAIVVLATRYRRNRAFRFGLVLTGIAVGVALW